MSQQYKLVLYTGQTFMAPAGTLYTPERIKQDFESIDIFPHVIQTDPQCEMCWAVSNLSAMRSQYNVPPEMSVDEALAFMEEKINAEPEPVVEEVDPVPSPEERIAAALEYQMLNSMDDV